MRNKECQWWRSKLIMINNFIGITVYQFLATEKGKYETNTVCSPHCLRPSQIELPVEKSEEEKFF